MPNLQQFITESRRKHQLASVPDNNSTPAPKIQGRKPTAAKKNYWESCVIHTADSPAIYGARALRTKDGFKVSLDGANAPRKGQSVRILFSQSPYECRVVESLEHETNAGQIFYELRLEQIKTNESAWKPEPATEDKNLKRLLDIDAKENAELDLLLESCAKLGIKTQLNESQRKAHANKKPAKSLSSKLNKWIGDGR